MKYALLLSVLVACAVAQKDYNRGYFQYANVKGAKEYEHGYNRGNPQHFRTHHQRNKDHTFQAKMTWGDYVGGHGEHYFEYNHGPKSAAYEKPAPYAPRPYLPYKPAYN
ncbi:uncharacterized protein LOC119104000 [Pollicipes pollicipes]|uniref:uncharacterized protein LOC119102195 n=1 Tax=Pollicipes pollicipes TaxID=41117 RepID=UPI00188545F9|nr:uncharacterized protein LOC119102195 [Pollicipes pollicipes]XP_037083609.1 uncharacterized protein LOC119104000 [Pollicipes pollicipes]